MKYVLALIVTLALTGAAPAQHAHGNKGPNGGQLQDVAGVHAGAAGSQAVRSPSTYSTWSNKPVGTKGFIASALVARGSERETVVLVPSEEVALKGDARKSVPRRSRRHARLKRPEGSPDRRGSSRRAAD